MKATAHRTSATGFTHRIDVRNHELAADEPVEQGGDDDGPSPQELLAASLASCTAVTVEMYAKRKGWDIGQLEVMCDYTPAERGCPTKFKVELRIANGCTQDQIEKLRIIAAKCPVHRTLEGEVMFEDAVKLVAPATT